MKYLITFNFTKLPCKRIIVDAPSFQTLGKKIELMARDYLVKEQYSTIEEAVMELYTKDAIPKQNTFNWL